MIRIGWCRTNVMEERGAGSQSRSASVAVRAAKRVTQQNLNRTSKRGGMRTRPTLESGARHGGGRGPRTDASEARRHG